MKIHTITILTFLHMVYSQSEFIGHKENAIWVNGSFGITGDIKNFGPTLGFSMNKIVDISGSFSKSKFEVINDDASSNNFGGTLALHPIGAFEKPIFGFALFSQSAYTVFGGEAFKEKDVIGTSLSYGVELYSKFITHDKFEIIPSVGFQHTTFKLEFKGVSQEDNGEVSFSCAVSILINTNDEKKLYIIPSYGRVQDQNIYGITIGFLSLII